MWKRPGVVAAIIVLFGNAGFLISAAQQGKPHLPRILRASMPLYPPLAQQAAIQGVVTLRVSTDGKRVSTIDGVSGPPLLVRAATENVKTWEFAPDAPTSFGVTFNYRLSLPPDCECTDCDGPEKQSLVLHLPTSLEVSAIIPGTCDPPEEINKRR
jgi:hypothetical protein